MINLSPPGSTPEQAALWRAADTKRRRGSSLLTIDTKTTERVVSGSGEAERPKVVSVVPITVRTVITPK